jgi:glutathione peroxidase
MPQETEGLYDISVRRIDGSQTSLREYQGDALLIVNVASECGFTPQYEGLQQLYRERADRGLRVLGFPCNQFGAQEPGTNSAVAEFCSTRFGVTFPMFEKIDVNGPNRHPLYSALIAARPRAEKSDSTGTPDITWNFEKFLVNRDGAVVARFAPDVAPENSDLRAAIEQALG